MESGRGERGTGSQRPPLEDSVGDGPAWLAHLLALPCGRALHSIADNEFANGSHANAFQFPPPCYEPSLPTGLNTGRCSGEWSPNVTIYDQLRVPQHLEPGEYVLGLRYDCEASAQVWNSCADIVITHAAAGANALGL